MKYSFPWREIYFVVILIIDSIIEDITKYSFISYRMFDMIISFLWSLLCQELTFYEKCYYWIFPPKELMFYEKVHHWIFPSKELTFCEKLYYWVYPTPAPTYYDEALKVLFCLAFFSIFIISYWYYLRSHRSERKMVRKYQRKTQRANWSEEAMQSAINDVINGAKKLREAARAFNIPVMTLKGRLKTCNSTKIALGHKTVLTQEQENEIADQVLLLAKTFYGISSVELRRLVFEYAEKNGIKHPFNKASKLAGHDWLQGFLKRNPRISVRKPESTSMSRITAFNKQEVDLFFENLSFELEKNQFPSSKIYNFDETGISTVQKPGTILGPKGVKQVGAATSWERGKNITVGCAMSAAGDYIPPMFIFPRKRMSPNLCRDGPPNSIYHCSQNGWITEDLFVIWLHHFIIHAKPSKEEPVLLVIDNHKTHTTLAAYNVCKENGIHVVTLPPHSSHRLQPLDITFFSSLKAAFNKECDNFLRSHHLEKITPYYIAAIFNNAYVKVANIGKGISGFESAGIFPLNPGKFTEEDFAVRSEVEQRLPQIEDDGVGSLDTSISGNLNNPISAQTNTDDKDQEPGKVDGSNESDAVSFKSLCPTPQLKTVKVTPRQQHSIIFTKSPNKSKLEELDKVKELKKKIQQLQAKIKIEEECRRKLNRDNKTSKSRPRTKGNSKPRRTTSKTAGSGKSKEKNRRNINFDESSSSSDNLIDGKGICQDDDMDDMDPMESILERGITREASGSKDICLLCGDFGKDKELWFRCCSCAGWVHSACSSGETAENFVCDFCENI